jgi:hypothetical protein
VGRARRALCRRETIYNWASKAPAGLSINGVSQSPGHNFRQGAVIDTSGNYAMVIWVGLSATSNQSFEITVGDPLSAN